MTPNILVIIPAYNEEAAIGKVIADIPASLVSEVVVVDNGSMDRTAEAALSKGATVIHEPQKGYGAACLKGIEYAEAKDDGSRPEIIVFLDGDYSDFPDELADVIEPIIKKDYDLVIGSRNMGLAEPGALLPHAVIGNKIATLLIRLLYGEKFTDLGPFRAIKFDRLLELEMEDRNFGWTVEMQVKAVKMGFRCTEVPVRYRKRIGVSKVTGTLGGAIKAGYKIICTIFKHQ